jgi:hypothetical protein
MLSKFNNITRQDLLDLVKEDLGGRKTNLRIKKLNTHLLRPTARPLTKISETNIISLKSMESLEGDLTREHTILESPCISLADQSFSSYTYLKDLANKVKLLYKERDKKAKSSIRLPSMRNNLDKEMLNIRNVEKRKTLVEKNEVILKLIPCFGKGFMINLIECEKH